MRFVKGLFLALLGVIALALVAGLFLPGQAHVERSVTMNAPPAAIYPIVNGFGRFNEWSPWAGLDPKTTYTYTGPSTGVGAVMTWHSDDPNVGSGRQEIIAVEPDRAVTMKLDFGGSSPSQATMTFVPEGTGSRVTWAFDADFTGHYFDRYIGVLFDRFIGPDYEKGLAQLKTLVEAAPAAP